MNILHITATYVPSTNGVAITTQRTVSVLRALGHTVWVIGPRYNHQEEKESYIPFPTIYHLPFIPRDYPLIVPYLSRKQTVLLMRIPWDIIHVHHPFAVGALARRIGSALDVPVVFTYHTQYDQVARYFVPWLPKGIHRALYTHGVLKVGKTMDRVIATTTWLAKTLQQRLPLVPISYVTTAGLPKPFLLPTKKRVLRQRLNLPLEYPIFLCVSRVSREKNIGFLIDAYRQWFRGKKRGCFVVVGDGNDRTRLERYVRDIRLSGHVLFVGKIANDQLPAWYSAADIFLYSGIHDTIGVNVVEAMSAGLPVVAIDHVVSREIVRDDDNGVLAPEEARVFAKAMDRALVNHRKLTIGALKTVSDYTLSKTTGQLLSVYNATIDAHTRRHQ
ncbi:MAG: glycosyltransferase [Patescibacteria group bacterium]